MKYLNSIHSEWLKTTRSSASWLCLAGGFFLPVLYFIGFLKEQSSINAYKTDIWETYFMQSWQNMAVFLLPMGVILATSLITQIEIKNNTWKQVHATPQSYITIYFSKFAVILLMTLKFFIFFNIGILLSATIPCLLFSNELPKENLPVIYFLKWNLKFFITCLPILAIQYLLSLHFKNFMISIGIGLAGLIGSLIGLGWKYIYLSPYVYTTLTKSILKIEFNVYLYAIIYTVIMLVINLGFYLNKKDKS